MKKYCFTLTLVFVFSIFSAVSPGFSSAQTDPKTPAVNAEAIDNDEALIATIDIAAVYALHPMMRYYDSKLDLFIKPPKPGTTFDEFMNIMQSRRKEFQKSYEGYASELKRIKSEIDVLKKEIDRLDYLKNSESAPVIEKFNAQISKAAKEEEKKTILTQRTQELSKIEKKFNIELDKKNKSLSALSDSYENIQKTLLKIYYLTPEETLKIFEAINLEIRDTIKFAADKKKVKAVININMVSKNEDKKEPVKKTVDEKLKFNYELDSLLANGPDYTKILGILRTFESTIPKDLGKDKNASFNEEEYKKMLKKMNDDREKESASENIINKESVMQIRHVQNLTATPVFHGGTDITWLTVIALMVKNGIPKEKAEIISEVLLGSKPAANKK